MVGALRWTGPYATLIDVWSYDDPGSPYAYFALWEITYGELWGRWPIGGIHGSSLVFGPDAQWLYAFMGYSSDEPTVKLVILRPLYRAARLQVDGFGYIKYGDERLLVARLSGGTAAAEVQLYARPRGHDHWRLRATGTVDAQGRVSFLVAPRVNTRYRLVYPGEEGWFGASKAGVVHVRVRVVGKLFGGAGRVGRWRIYRSDQPVFYAAAVSPPYRGEEVRVALYRYREGRGWRLIAAGRFPQNRDGIIAVSVPAGSLRAGDYRMMASFEPEERDRVEGWSRYAYLRVRP
jgi:hypothetical protein